MILKDPAREELRTQWASLTSVDDNGSFSPSQAVLPLDESLGSFSPSLLPQRPRSVLFEFQQPVP